MHVLVNVISRRVRQLNSGGGGISRPLVVVTPEMGVADIALLELLEEKIGYELATEASGAGPERQAAPDRSARDFPTRVNPARWICSRRAPRLPAWWPKSSANSKARCDQVIHPRHLRGGHLSCTGPR